MTAPGPPPVYSPLPPPGSSVVGIDGVMVGRVAAVVPPTSGIPVWVPVTLTGTDDVVPAPLCGAERTTTGIAVAVDAATVQGAPLITGTSSALTEADDTAACNYYRHIAGPNPRMASPEGPRPGGTPAGQIPGDSSAAPPDAATIRSREDLVVRTEWVPYRRTRLRKRVVTEERAITVTVRREELVIDDSDIAPEQAVSAAERPQHQLGEVSAPGNGEIEVILHAEVPVVDTRIVAVERVRARVIVVDDHPVEVADRVRHEEVDIEPS